ncbi:hypothetical protein D1007_40902 [Hordeum vulgare]|nr:hypothetical protein D1007_40902 [Hordeum vulgare]
MSINPSTTDSLLIDQDNTGYAGDDSSSEDESSSLNANKSLGHNYMSQDESYSGNVHANDDNDDYDIDDQSYAESGTQTDEHGDMSYFAGGVDGSNGNDEHVGDLDFDLDIGYDEYQQETLDMHWEVMAKTFRSEGEAYMFYNHYVKDRGFSIRRDLKRFGKADDD